MTSYWHKTLARRMSRRTALAATGSAAAAAAFLAACGGSDGGESGGTKQETSSLLAKREDTTKEAKTGGTLIMTNPADPPHFDPHLLTLPAAAATSFIFNKLMQVKPGVLQITDGTMQGDLTESWEFSPDKLTLTMKLRTDAGTPPSQAPLNGRKLDAQDVVYSWNRWSATGSNRMDLVNAANPAAPVLSLTAADNRTIVIKLKDPVSSILAGFSSQLQGQFFIIPREAEGGFDVRRQPIGAGTYYLSEYVPSSRLVYTRNPNSYDKQAYPAKIETPIITEAAQITAQLIAGNIYTPQAVSAESVLQIKKDAPQIGLYQTDIGNFGVSVFYGFRNSEKARFRDVRLRQALSMSVNRDLFLETLANGAKFKAEGLPVETDWNSALNPSDYKGWFVSPKSKEFGENGKYFQHNVAEAKKLLAAAGFASGLEVESQESAGTNYGVLYHPQLLALQGMAAEAGFKFNKIQHQIGAWNPEFRDSRGFFEGIGWRLTPRPAEPGDGLFALYNKNGSLNYGFDAEGKGLGSKEGPFNGDPTCDDLTNKMRTEFDNNKRVQYAVELQKYHGKQQYFVHAFASTSGFNVAWPAVRNFSVFNGLAWGYLWKNYWIDETQAPIKKT